MAVAAQSVQDRPPLLPLYDMRAQPHFPISVRLASFVHPTENRSRSLRGVGQAGGWIRSAARGGARSGARRRCRHSLPAGDAKHLEGVERVDRVVVLNQLQIFLERQIVGNRGEVLFENFYIALDDL